MTTYATARGGDWIDVQCDQCPTKYSCFVEGIGSASNQFMPFSQQTLKDFASSDLRDELKGKAARIPCPKCGAYGEAVVEETQNKARRRTFWAVLLLGGPLLLIGTSNLLNALITRADPNQPPSWFIWVILGSLITSLVAARLTSQVAFRSTNLNRDPEENRRSAQRKVAAGQVKILPETGK
jgi:hypothetical protein